MALRSGVAGLHSPSIGQKNLRSSGGSATALVLRSNSWRSGSGRESSSSFGLESLTVRAFATMPPAPASDQDDSSEKGRKGEAASEGLTKGKAPETGGSGASPGVPTGSLSKSQQQQQPSSAETHPNGGVGKVGDPPTATTVGSPTRAADNATVAALRNPVSMNQRAVNLLKSLPGAVASGSTAFAAWCAQFSKELASDPRRKTKEIWAAIKHEANHYWVGSKLLWADVKIATKILGRLAMGHRLTRREHMQMVRELYGW